VIDTYNVLVSVARTALQRANSAPYSLDRHQQQPVQHDRAHDRSLIEPPEALGRLIFLKLFEQSTLRLPRASSAKSKATPG
jgi:hypothetical protein